MEMKFAAGGLERLLILTVLVFGVIGGILYIGLPFYNTYLGGAVSGGVLPTGQPANVQQQVTVAGSCPDTGRVAVRLMGISSVLSTTGTETPVNGQNAGVQLKDSTSLMDTIALVNTGFVASTAGSEIPCGTDFNILFPATTSTVWYNQKMPMTGVSAAFIDYKFVADQAGTVALSAQNATTTPGYTTGTLAVTVPVSGTDTGLYLKIKENSGAVYRGPLMVGIAYDIINYTSIEVIGATQVSCPSGIGTWTDSNGAVKSFQKCFALAAGDLKNYGSTIINFKIVTGANVITNATPGGNWSMTIMDYGARVKNGGVVNEYRNSDTGGTIGAADATFKVMGAQSS